MEELHYYKKLKENVFPSNEEQKQSVKKERMTMPQVSRENKMMKTMQESMRKMFTVK